MKSFSILIITIITIACCFTSCRGKVHDSETVEFSPGVVRNEILFDFNWRFYRGDTVGAQEPVYDDSQWRILDLPHDWSIEDIPGTESPLDSTAIGNIDAGYFTGGTGWYRKTFFLSQKPYDKNFILQFDGVYMNSDIWLNGIHLGNHPYGYTSFRFNITDAIKQGKNVLAVIVRNEGRNSRWYSGSGIYRHVWLIIKDAVSLDPWNVYITAHMVDKINSIVNVKTAVLNKTGKNETILLSTLLFDPSDVEVDYKETVRALNADEEVMFDVSFDIDSPLLWTPEEPWLYTAVNEIYIIREGGERVLRDRLKTTFGIRSVSVNAQHGFLLNGVPLKLKGGCMHHDNGPLGAAAFDRAEERRVELMKASGFNAVRCAHNPPSPTFLDACDRLGMLVIDEAFDMWREPKNPDDYHKWFNEWWKKDLENMVLRDRNHPSVVMWSIGNEVPERGKPEGAALAKEMSDFVKSLDPARPVTSAVNSVTPDKDLFFAALDVCGYNYALDKYVSDHLRLPERIILGTESFPLEAFEYWQATALNQWIIGDFVWTGFDYLGEASIGWLGYPHKGNFFPWNHAFCGDLDICGFKRPQSFYRDVLWGESKMAAIFVKPPEPSFPLNPGKAKWSKWEWHDVVASWNWEGYEGQPLTVVVYSNCDEIELFINSKSLGKKISGPENKFITPWEVPYEEGTLLAKGSSKDRETVISELKTAGKPVRIELTADRSEIKADRQDLSYVTVKLIDENGIRNPAADNLVKFFIEGSGEILAVGSSNPMSTESFKKPQRRAWQGRCLVIVRAGNKPGIIKLRAQSDGLEASDLEINVMAK
ncbi:MAG: glycoside hydrolase family 2 TIM barrel-domain containing protein [Bacteroidales bacterium]